MYKRRNRIKILPDDIFYILWKEAQISKSEQDFISSIIHQNSEKKIDFKKYDFEAEHIYECLREIYSKANMSFKDILKETELRQADVSKIFCIPKRTIENWSANKTECPSYIRLMILRECQCISLGKLIYTSHQYDLITKKPRIYQKNYSLKKSCTPDFDYSDVGLINEKDFENIENSIKARELILEKTNYLDEILNRK